MTRLNCATSIFADADKKSLVAAASAVVLHEEAVAVAVVVAVEALQKH